MTPEQIFSIANLVALAGWILLAVLPGRVWVSKVVTAVLIPALLAAVYVPVLALNWGTSEGGFGSLAHATAMPTIAITDEASAARRITGPDTS